MDDRHLVLTELDEPVCRWLRIIRFQTACEDAVASTSSVNDSLVNRRTESVRDSVFYQYFLDLSSRSGVVVAPSISRGCSDDMNWLQSLCPCLQSTSSAEDQYLNLVTNESIPSTIPGEISLSQTDDLQSSHSAETIEEDLGVTVTEILICQEPDIEPTDQVVPVGNRPSRRLESIPPPLSLRRISEVSCELTPDLKFGQINPIRFPCISFDELPFLLFPVYSISMIRHQSQRRASFPTERDGNHSPVFSLPIRRRSWPFAFQANELIEKPVVQVSFHSQSDESREGPLLACAGVCERLSCSDAVVWRTSSTRLLRSRSLVHWTQVLTKFT